MCQLGKSRNPALSIFSGCVMPSHDDVLKFSPPGDLPENMHDKGKALHSANPFRRNERERVIMEYRGTAYTIFFAAILAVSYLITSKTPGTTFDYGNLHSPQTEVHLSEFEL